MSEKLNSLISKFVYMQYRYFANLFLTTNLNWKTITDLEAERLKSQEDLTSYIEQLEYQVNELKGIIALAKEPLQEEADIWTLPQAQNMPFLLRVKKALNILERIENEDLRVENIKQENVYDSKPDFEKIEVKDKQEKTINELIEAGQALVRVAQWSYTILPELLAWDTLVEKIYKERNEQAN